MLSYIQWKTQMEGLSQRLARTSQRAKGVLMRVKKLREKAEVETNLKKIREGIDAKK